jgi:hypothetical protein
MASSRLVLGRNGSVASILLAPALLLLNTLGLTQSELVVHKEGTTLYHRPSCPLILDGAGVLAMTRAQAEARGYKPHPDCDPANPKPSARRVTPSPPATVYVDGAKYYHRKDCSKLTDPKARKAVSLDIVGKTHWPCPACRPPIRQRGAENAVPGTKPRGR